MKLSKIEEGRGLRIVKEPYCFFKMRKQFEWDDFDIVNENKIMFKKNKEVADYWDDGLSRREIRCVNGDCYTTTHAFLYSSYGNTNLSKNKIIRMIGFVLIVVPMGVFYAILFIPLVFKDIFKKELKKEKGR